MRQNFTGAILVLEPDVVYQLEIRNDTGAKHLSGESASIVVDTRIRTVVVARDAPFSHLLDGLAHARRVESKARKARAPRT
jgi:hypothetical protein